MKKIIIYCVTYNSYNETRRFLESVNVAALQAESSMISVIVIDNTEKDKETIFVDYSNINVRVLQTAENCGYLGAVKKGMDVFSPENYDFFIISNVDLVVAPNAFCKLLAVNITDKVGWIAPQIFSTLENRDRNPARIGRYTSKHLKVLLFLYNNPWINRLYELTIYKIKNCNTIKYEEGTEIYSGHGSFMIFTKDFFCRNGIPDYPIFLYGEEIFIAELCRRAGLKTVYVPSVKVIDSEHCSTSRMSKTSNCKWNANAIKFLLKEFF